MNALNFKELQVLNYLLKKLKCYEFIHPKIIMHIHESRLHNIWGRGRHNSGYEANLVSDIISDFFSFENLDQFRLSFLTRIIMSSF